MIITVQLQIGNRVVTEQLSMDEEMRGDFRRAITECASRLELSSYGPQSGVGYNFDEILRGKQAGL